MNDDDKHKVREIIDAGLRDVELPTDPEKASKEIEWCEALIYALHARIENLRGVGESA